MKRSYRSKCNEEFKYEQTLMVNENQALMIIRKICRHYKMPMPYDVIFHLRHRGFYRPRDRAIHLPKREMTLWLLIHELNHYYDHFKRGWITRKSGRHYHTNKLFTKEKRLMNYVRKKNYWNIDHGWKQYQDEGGSMTNEHFLERLEELKQEHFLIQKNIATFK